MTTHLGPYRTAARDAAPEVGAYRVIREPYIHNDYRARYLLQKRVRFLWWSWWRTIDWSFGWGVISDRLRALHKPEPPLLPIALIWKSGDDIDAVSEPLFGIKVGGDEDDEDEDDLDEEDDL
jgi:hypothetical protein